jgi:DNA-binding CsgD family transcriptional regulator
MDAAVHMIGRPEPARVRVATAARSPLAASLLMFAAIGAARFSVHASQSAGILLLLIAPIVVLSLAYGLRTGVAAASAGLCLYVVSQEVKAGGLDVISVATRAFTFYAVPLTTWLARRPAADPAPLTQPAAAAPVDVAPADVQLTPREREVLALVAAGHTSAQIADQLVLSVRTIESHRASLRRKLGRPTQPELVRHAQLSGLVPVDGTTGHTSGVALPGRACPRGGLLRPGFQ